MIHLAQAIDEFIKRFFGNMRSRDKVFDRKHSTCKQPKSKIEKCLLTTKNSEPNTSARCTTKSSLTHPSTQSLSSTISTVTKTTKIFSIFPQNSTEIEKTSFPFTNNEIETVSYQLYESTSTILLNWQTNFDSTRFEELNTKTDESYESLKTSPYESATNNEQTFFEESLTETEILSTSNNYSMTLLPNIIYKNMTIITTTFLVEDFIQLSFPIYNGSRTIVFGQNVTSIELEV